MLNNVKLNNYYIIVLCPLCATCLFGKFAPLRAYAPYSQKVLRLFGSPILRVFLFANVNGFTCMLHLFVGAPFIAPVYKPM